jgi:hypothetical protein
MWASAARRLPKITSPMANYRKFLFTVPRDRRKTGAAEATALRSPHGSRCWSAFVFCKYHADRDRIEKKISQHFSHTTTSREGSFGEDMS